VHGTAYGDIKVIIYIGLSPLVVRSGSNSSQYFIFHCFPTFSVTVLLEYLDPAIYTRLVSRNLKAVTAI